MNLPSVSPGAAASTVVSVNIGQPEALRIGQKTATSGIHKVPVGGRVRIGPGGLDGDHILSKKHHGGPDQAAYLYTTEDYEFWAQALGKALPPGQFGENLTVSGWRSAELRIGDRFQIGGAELEVTAPRIPCATLAAHLGDPAFAKRFAQAGRPGAYLRVLQSGEVAAGDAVTYIPGPHEAPTLLELFTLWYEKSPPREALERALQFPVAARLRKNLTEWLAEQPG